MPGIRSFVSNNLSRPCSARGCGNRRSSASRYCGKHDARLRRHGDLNGGAPTKKQMQKYTRLAHLHVKQWQHVEPLLDVLLELQDMIAPGGEPQKYLNRYGPAAKKGLRSDNPRWYLWRHLLTLADPERVAQRHEHGGPKSRGKSLPKYRPAPAAPTECLEAILSVWLSQEIGNLYRNDEAVTLALGRAVLSRRSQPVVRSYIDKDTYRPVPQRRKLSSVAVKLMGQMIRDRLGLTLMKATDQVRQDDTRRVARREGARKSYPAGSARTNLASQKPVSRQAPVSVSSEPRRPEAAPTPAVAAPVAPPVEIVAAPPTPGASGASPSWIQYLARNNRSK
jgi:hypothetical protein